jgi:hypothetical protein
MKFLRKNKGLAETIDQLIGYAIRPPTNWPSERDANRKRLSCRPPTKRKDICSHVKSVVIACWTRFGKTTPLQHKFSLQQPGRLHYNFERRNEQPREVIVAEKAPYLVMVDPTVENTITIKPFAAELAKRGTVHANVTGSGGVTYQNGHWDGSGDVDS